MDRYATSLLAFLEVSKPTTELVGWTEQRQAQPLSLVGITIFWAAPPETEQQRSRAWPTPSWSEAVCHAISDTNDRNTNACHGKYLSQLRLLPQGGGHHNPALRADVFPTAPKRTQADATRPLPDGSNRPQLLFLDARRYRRFALACYQLNAQTVSRHQQTGHDLVLRAKARSLDAPSAFSM
jgi:hypothetical protein